MVTIRLRVHAIAADAARPRHTLRCLGMPWYTLVSVMRAAGIKDAVSQLHRLSDYSLIYFDGDEVQLARPCDAYEYFSAGVPVRRHMLLVAMLRQSRQGGAAQK